MGEHSYAGLADCEYTSGYYAELNPTLVPAAFVSAGIRPPQIRNACELGFGVGLSVNIHAAASSVRWYGNDANPTHASLARDLAATSGAECHLSDETFDRFCARDDLPDFDYVGLHGILSWIGQTDWDTIAEFLDRKLRPGGVLYCSYNVLPGWADVLSVRTIFREYVAQMTPAGMPLGERIAASVGFLRELLTTEPRILNDYPRLQRRIDSLGQLDLKYLAHEYLCDDWRCIHFSELATFLSKAGLTYACSATLHEHLRSLHFNAEQLAVFKRLPDPALRETVADFFSNRQFRKDFWVKGARPLSTNERWDMARAQRVVMTRHADKVERSITGFLGNFNIDPRVSEALIGALADHRPQRIADLLDGLSSDELAARDLLQGIYLLMSNQGLAIAQEDDEIDAARNSTQRLNRRLIAEAENDLTGEYVASPITGGGIAMGGTLQQFLRAKRAGVDAPSEWAARANASMLARGRRVLVDGSPASTPEANARELERLATDFAQCDLPIFESLAIC